jgi:hypothetical protein
MAQSHTRQFLHRKHLALGSGRALNLLFAPFFAASNVADTLDDASVDALGANRGALHRRRTITVLAPFLAALASGGVICFFVVHIDSSKQ